LAVDQDGHVWAWGLNDHGRLGDGTSASRSRPFQLPGIDNVRSVAAGANWTSMALQRDGNVWTWGNNFSGQLGDGTIGGYSTSPAAVAGLTNVIAIAAHTYHMLAVKDDGTVRAWGANDNGQLGLGTTSASLVPVAIPGLSGVRSVVASSARSFAVMADGSVRAWGSGNWGALGDGSWREFNQLTPKPVSGVTQVIELASADHTLALRVDGTVWGWGQTWGGSELGRETPGSTPGPITHSGPMLAIAASQQVSALLGVDGLLNMGGANALGQLGDGTFAQHADFVLAVSPDLNGYLNLNNASAARIRPTLQTPFFLSSHGGIASASASVATTTQFNPADRGKPGSVFITASVPTDSSIARSAQGAVAAIGPHPNKAAATTPASGFTLIQLTPSGWQTVVNGQLIPYASGVLSDQLAAQTLLNGTDTTSLKGAEFCVGYGTTAADMVVNGNIRAVATIPGATTTASCVVGGTLSVALSVEPGWNLLGNPVNQSIAVASQFGDPAKVNSVWKWDNNSAAKWQFYAPDLSATELQRYAADQGYAVLSEIQAGDGFWVNAKTPADLGTLSGTAINLRQSSMASGWNLMATASTVTPQDFNLSLSTTPPPVGQVPVNLTSLWAWDSAKSQWFFYAPGLEANALTQFIAGKGYRDFGTNSKTLGGGTGFWVSRP
jgi:hypothetical protein